MEEYNTIHLVLDDDSETDCQVVGIFTVDDIEYIVLITIDTEEVLFYRYSTDEDGINLEPPQDEEEFKRVAEKLTEIFEEECDEDDDCCLDHCHCCHEDDDCVH